MSCNSIYDKRSIVKDIYLDTNNNMYISEFMDLKRIHPRPSIEFFELVNDSEAIYHRFVYIIKNDSINRIFYSGPNNKKMKIFSVDTVKGLLVTDFRGLSYKYLNNNYLASKKKYNLFDSNFIDISNHDKFSIMLELSKKYH